VVSSSLKSSSSSTETQPSLIIQESEAGFCRVDGTIGNNNGGFTGAGFADTNSVQGAAVVWAVESSNSGRQTLTFRYANGGAANRNGSLLINGGANGNYTLSLPVTSGWTDWQIASIEVDLVQGNNILQLSAATAEGLPNIDSLSLTGGSVKAGNCSGVSSSSSSKSSSSSSVAPAQKFVGNITTSGAVRSDFAKYWNQITPENEGKWGSVESTRGVYNWTALDRLYTYARQNNIQVKAHTFLWGAQAPKWINNLSPAEQATSIEDWIRNFCTRYPDTKYIDVVNEAIPGHAPASFAKSAFGDNWIIKSFQLARKHCPNSVLILNDYNVTSWHTNEFIALAKPLIAAGVVDALGDQAHGLEGFSVADITNNLNKVAALGLPIYITEYDVAKTDDQEQLKIFQQQFPIFYNHPSVKGITLWGYVYGKTWVEGSGLIQDNGTPRPAMTWLMNYLGR
jgi:endo-1,4-beta-xylanase